MSRKPKETRRNEDASTVVVREMQFNDLAAVYQLGNRLFTAEQWPTLYRAWDEYELVELFSAHGEFCLVAELNDRVVGFALGNIMRKPQNPWRYGCLVWLGVARRLKGRGIGKRLLNRLTDLFIENGARMMLVDTAAKNHAALAFFRNQNFANEIQQVYLSKNLVSHPKYRQRKAELQSGKECDS